MQALSYDYIIVGAGSCGTRRSEFSTLILRLPAIHQKLINCGAEPSMSSVGMNALVPELADLDARQVERRPENDELKIVNQIFRQSGRYAGDGIGSACHERGSDETGHPDLHMVLVQLANQDLLEYLMHGMPRV
jgi:hypothetical protein